MANRKAEIDSMRITDAEARQRLISGVKTSYGGKIEEMWLYFILPGYENIELKPTGKSISVTLDNLQEYIDLAIEALLHETIKI